MREKDIKIGSHFGYWTVTGPSIVEKRVTAKCTNYVTRFPCVCICGTKRLVRAQKLLRNSASCRCKYKEVRREKGSKTIKHDDSHTRLYRIWRAIKQRCHNPKNTNYHLYGARGVSVHKTWREDYTVFKNWATTTGYAEHLQLDRINNNGNYEPNNCQWSSSKENSRNKRTTHFLTAFGETKCITDWALDPRCSVTPSTINYRITKLKMCPKDAIASPRKGKKKSPSFKTYYVKKHRTPN